VADPLLAEIQKLKTLLDDKKAPPEQVAHAVDALGEVGVVALGRAAKGSKRREQRRVSVLFALGDRVEHAAADEALRVLLRGAASEAREMAVQVAAFKPARRRFATELRAIARDAADPSWDSAVYTLGALRDPEAAALFVAQAKGIDTSFRIVQSLVGLRDPIARPVFEAIVRHPDLGMRTFALWGLAALGHQTPTAQLVALLEDPDRHTANTYDLGQAIRAAQALCDVHGWPFEGDKSAVAATRARARERFTREHIERCVRALERGDLDLD
jgi:HEAT repeat protein